MVNITVYLQRLSKNSRMFCLSNKPRKTKPLMDRFLGKTLLLEKQDEFLKATVYVARKIRKWPLKLKLGTVCIANPHLEYLSLFWNGSRVQQERITRIMIQFHNGKLQHNIGIKKPSTMLDKSIMFRYYPIAFKLVSLVKFYPSCSNVYRVSNANFARNKRL